jgi:hypothetical protein
MTSPGSPPLFLESQLRLETLHALRDLPDVRRWLRDLQDAAEALPPSAVHRRQGDVTDLAVRTSHGKAGKDPDVFHCLQERVLPQLENYLPGRLEVFQGHYDLIAYSPGGFFSKHVDHVSAYGPEFRCWHLLICIDARCCDGGRTAIHDADRVYDSAASVTPGGVLVLRSGVAHEGLPVTRGRKVVLRCDVYQFLTTMHHAAADHADRGGLRCRCSDGYATLPLGLVSQTPFFSSLLSFEGPRDETRLESLSVEDCETLVRHLSRSAGDAEHDPEELRLAHDLLHYVMAPEGELGFQEFLDVRQRGCVRTTDRQVARRLAAVAQDSGYCFLGIIQCWTVHVEDIWDLCLEQCDVEEFLSNPCVVASGDVLMTTWPGFDSPARRGRRKIAAIDLNDGTRRHLRLYEFDAAPRDTFGAMEALIEKEICHPSVDRWHRWEDRTDEASSLEVENDLPPPAVSARQAVDLARALQRRLRPAEFKELLERCSGVARYRHEVYEEVCNDGESFWTATSYETKVFQYEWLLVDLQRWARGTLDLPEGLTTKEM